MVEDFEEVKWYGRVYFRDEAPAIGCGWRGIELLDMGWKWARIRERSTGTVVRMLAKNWLVLCPEGVPEDFRYTKRVKKGVRSEGQRKNRSVRTKS